MSILVVPNPLDVFVAHLSPTPCHSLGQQQPESPPWQTPARSRAPNHGATAWKQCASDLISPFRSQPSILDPTARVSPCLFAGKFANEPLCFSIS